MIVYQAIGLKTGIVYCEGDQAFVLRSLQDRYPSMDKSVGGQVPGSSRKQRPRNVKSVYPEPLHICRIGVVQ
ncbi:hypothetical protein [Enterococcus timonensis]|uniref:hypothetical protein n=1 Tax=Enterococcus timonensis TaxID=1852364 RepID=UPI0008D9D9ED|nr:hypothetical protein [Enterococcus timonensis]